MATLHGSIRITGTAEAADFLGLRETKRIVGDGVSRVFTLTHSLGEKLVLPTLYDARGFVTPTAAQCVSESEVRVFFYHPPAAGEIFDLVLRK